jgi:septal ring-binding cell division protein DamX
VSALDGKIDDLYRLPLAEFTGARNALAKSLGSDDAKRVKALAKPTVVPWAVNQVYWRARATYDRLMKSGEKLRTAQIAALEGRHADVRAAGDMHRRAIGEAVAEAERLSAPSGVKPGTDALARTFESLSLATSAPEAPGRLTEALQPAGFEALLGVTPSQVRSTTSEVRKPELVKSAGEPRTPNPEPRTSAAAKAAERAAAKAAARAAAAKAEHEAAVKKAEEALARVQAAEQQARQAWERAHDDLLAARQALSDLRRSRFTQT